MPSIHKALGDLQHPPSHTQIHIHAHVHTELLHTFNINMHIHIYHIAYTQEHIYT